MEDKKVNWFTRILIILLSLLIVSMIIYNFYFTLNGKIESGLLSLLILLIILVLSEVFDNLSFGKFLSLSKNIKEKKQEINDIKQEKKDILNLLVSNINVQKQSQTNGFSASEMKDIIRIIKADPDKVIAENKEKEAAEELENTPAEKIRRKSIDTKKLEKLIFEKFMVAENLDKYVLREQVQLASNDPICSTSPAIDGYIETKNAEIFIEIKRGRGALMLREGLYQRLMNIFYYKEFKKVNTFLALILVELPNDDYSKRTKERLETYFAPAIDKGIMEIFIVKINDEEQTKIYRD